MVPTSAATPNIGRAMYAVVTNASRTSPSRAFIPRRYGFGVTSSLPTCYNAWLSKRRTPGACRQQSRNDCPRRGRTVERVEMHSWNTGLQQLERLHRRIGYAEILHGFRVAFPRFHLNTQLRWNARSAKSDETLDLTE